MPPQNHERAPLLGGDSHQSYNQSQNNPFKFSAKELGDLIDPKNPDKLREYGDVDGILSALKTDVKKGISKDENLNTHANGEGESSPFESRINVFGKNVMPEVPQQTLLELIWEAYQDKTLVLLSIAALVSLAVGLYEDSLKGDNGEPKVGWVEGVAIFIAVVVVVLTNSINDYQKEKQFRKLNAKKEDRTVKLIRDGREETISVFDIQVGDILLLEPGDIVPTDGVYIEGHHLVCDESSATGESDAIKKGSLKDNMDPFILSGSKVQEGVARIVVIAVGVHSFHGKTMMAMRDGGENDLTPLQIKLDSLAESIAKLGMAAALIMLFTLSLKYWIIALVNNQIPSFADGFAVMVKIVIQAITIVVVAVPEGLPMAVTLALAFATTQMIKDNNLVRILAACETMGNATVICTDKTGTLTQNLMTVVQGIIAGTSMDGTPNPKDFKRKLADPVLKLLIEGISVNSSAFEGKDENGKVGFVGSKTEVALLNFGVNMGEDVKSPRDNRKVGLVYPFASKNKSMTTVIETPDSDTPYRQYTKGASEIVLEACTHYLDGDGKVQQMDQASRDNYLRTISRFAHQALRTICLAYRDISKADFDAFNPEQAPLEHLVAIGIVGIEDPLREGVVESVAECRRAGVYVKMITGDNVETAKAIAKKAGIWSPGGVVISGPEFRRLSPEEQTAIVPRLQVLARSSPTDKQIVVRTLQNLHEVVAMTGDGTNDGPALKMSDVGFSMGIAGTEVAKEASAIILMDDNFNSIVKALRWGRAVNAGVRKFLQFQLTVNITAVIVAFVSAVASETNESVLTAVQLLWVNLIMDTLAALALATEPPTSDILDNPPVPRNASLITYKMWKHILGQAFFQITINLIFMYLGEKLIPGREHEVVKTVVFNSFVFLQIFNELNCRRINDELNIFHDIFNNWIFIAVQVIVIVGQIILVNYGGTAFSTVPLNAAEWIISIVIGALSLPVGFILRLLPDFGDDSAQVHKPVVSRERMMLESAIQDVSSKLKVYAALRHKPRRSTGGSRMKSVSSVHE